MSLCQVGSNAMLIIANETKRFDFRVKVSVLRSAGEGRPALCVTISCDRRLSVSVILRRRKRRGMSQQSCDTLVRRRVMRICAYMLMCRAIAAGMTSVDDHDDESAAGRSVKRAVPREKGGGGGGGGGGAAGRYVALRAALSSPAHAAQQTAVRTPRFCVR